MKTNATNVAEYIRERVEMVATGTLPAGEQFPLAPASTDSVRTLDMLRENVVVRWLEPLGWSDTNTAPRFGANIDYLSYFGDGWNAAAGNAPQWNGDGTSGWLWANHEYISGTMPTPTSAPTGQHLHFALWLRSRGVLANDVTSNVWAQADVDTYIRWYKKQLGGSWLHIVQDPSSGEWSVDRGSPAVRYDATSNTLVRLAGQAASGLDQRDTGEALPSGVVVGIMGDCAGGTTPWGTIITAEENVQDYYGDLETCWSSNQQLVSGQGFDPGAPVSPTYAASASSEFGRTSVASERHARDLYGYLAEMDPGVAADEYEGKTSPGVGHKKIGRMGRARWEAAAFAVDAGFRLTPNQPIVMYASDDRRSGRIYKLVSNADYTAGMSKAQIRALLDDARLYVAHFAGLNNATGDTMLATGAAPTEASPGMGQWIHLSVTSTDVAPNAAALGAPATTVGEALQSVSWNGLGAFPSDDMVRRALFTASAKIGAMELNRPEDIEWNPRDPSGAPRVYVTFTNHNRRTQLDQSGVLAANQPSRTDVLGSVFAMEEADPMNPGMSSTFEFFQVWHGTQGDGLYDAANPDNLLIDADGGVWFGTDGNFGTNGHTDALYYLDLDPAHQAGMPGIMTPTYGLGFRVLAGPSDAEATGPMMSSDMGTLFFAVQHPGENVYSTWPDGDEPLSSLVAVTFRPE